ncbi:nitrous oxide reductase accessory protein NosL [Azospirillum lipoferum]|uniref:Copper resistance protein CopZ n=1 Tax=Azospirillum lipoferum TaxID=193 RepID=A0A5A9FYI8_AZOLI|nr:MULTISPECIES: nitrous oxide reductase accessory protein NosL [Azospirillum]KAA0587156.1 copper resistance protein CopZ [Azospirillum lipoferum]MCP1615077.1 nitrous oxide reductase accessory protein NosL [Azospirillum lipoferum]MDW5532975.1 nitrous oxide reductase accessory protein NosL [Azospirillum sp. NL1]
MRTLRTLLLAAALLAPLSACKQEKAEVAPPPPVTLATDAIGHYCGMNLADHPGPKGQILVKGAERPIWLSSVRDTFAFTMLPEEPKEIRAIYVTDIAKAKDPTAPDMTVWVEARQAWYVLGSRLRGGMGEAEPYPFSDRAAAERFAQANGGTILRFADVHEDQILTPPAASVAEGEQ